MSGLDAVVEIVYGDRIANARGVLAVLRLAAAAGSTVVVRATGAAQPGRDGVRAAGAAVAVLRATE